MLISTSPVEHPFGSQFNKNSFHMGAVADQSAAALGQGLQFQAFPTACAYMLILLRGGYI